MKLPAKTLQKLALASVGAAALVVLPDGIAAPPTERTLEPDSLQAKDKTARPKPTPKPPQPPAPKPQPPSEPCPACGLG